MTKGRDVYLSVCWGLSFTRQSTLTGKGWNAVHTVLKSSSLCQTWGCYDQILRGPISITCKIQIQNTFVCMLYSPNNCYYTSFFVTQCCCESLSIWYHKLQKPNLWKKYHYSLEEAKILNSTLISLFIFYGKRNEYANILALPFETPLDTASTMLLSFSSPSLFLTFQYYYTIKVPEYMV